jgi:hypothetical protein
MALDMGMDMDMVLVDMHMGMVYRDKVLLIRPIGMALKSLHLLAYLHFQSYNLYWDNLYYMY